MASCDRRSRSGSCCSRNSPPPFSPPASRSPSPTAPSLRRWLVSPASVAALAIAAAIFAPFVAWNAEPRLGDLHQAARPRPAARLRAVLRGRVRRRADRAHEPACVRGLRRRGRGRPLAQVRQARLRRRSAAHSSQHDRSGRDLFPPACAARPCAGQLARAAVSRLRPSSRPTGSQACAATARQASGPRSPRRALWAAPLGLGASWFWPSPRRRPGFLPLGRGRPDRARSTAIAISQANSTRRAKAKGAPYVLTQGYALDLADERSTAIRRSSSSSPSSGSAGFSSRPRPRTCSRGPGLALAEAGRRYDLVLEMRFRSVEPSAGSSAAARADRSRFTSFTVSPILSRRCSTRLAVSGEVDLQAEVLRRERAPPSVIAGRQRAEAMARALIPAGLAAHRARTAVRDRRPALALSPLDEPLRSR